MLAVPTKVSHSCTSPPCAVRYPTNTGGVPVLGSFQPGTQSGTTRRPAPSAATDCDGRRAVTVCPAARLPPSSCCRLIQPSCQACGVFQQREAQQ